MKALVLLAALSALALPAKAAEGPAASVIAQDPLMRQIRKRMMESDGGVQTVTWVQGAHGQRVAIPLVDPASLGSAAGGSSAPGGEAGALGGLRTDHRLAAASARRAGAAGGRVRTPGKQLRHIDAHKGWQQ